MSKQSDLGKLGEELAVAYLKTHDHIILEQNYIWERSEVDIIATKNDRIIFVEVKTRMSPYLSDPALMVPIKKWKQIMRAADIYMKESDRNLIAQFDIVHVVTNKDYTKIEHYLLMMSSPLGSLDATLVRVNGVNAAMPEDTTPCRIIAPKGIAGLAVPKFGSRLT